MIEYTLLRADARRFATMGFSLTLTIRSCSISNSCICDFGNKNYDRRSKDKQRVSEWDGLQMAQNIYPAVNRRHPI